MVMFEMQRTYRVLRKEPMDQGVISCLKRALQTKRTAEIAMKVKTQSF